MLWVWAVRVLVPTRPLSWTAATGAALPPRAEGPIRCHRAGPQVVWCNSLYIDAAVARSKADGFPATEHGPGPREGGGGVLADTRARPGSGLGGTAGFCRATRCAWPTERRRARRSSTCTCTSFRVLRAMPFRCTPCGRRPSVPNSTATRPGCASCCPDHPEHAPVAPAPRDRRHRARPAAGPAHARSMMGGRICAVLMRASTEPTSTARWMLCARSRSAATSLSFFVRTEERSSSSSVVSVAGSVPEAAVTRSSRSRTRGSAAVWALTSPEKATAAVGALPGARAGGGRTDPGVRRPDPPPGRYACEGSPGLPHLLFRLARRSARGRSGAAGRGAQRRTRRDRTAGGRGQQGPAGDCHDTRFAEVLPVGQHEGMSSLARHTGSAVDVCSAHS